MTDLIQTIKDAIKKCGEYPEIEDYDLSALWVKTTLQKILQLAEQERKELIEKVEASKTQAERNLSVLENYPVERARIW